MRKRLLFQVPFQCYLSGPSEDSLSLRGRFEVSHFLVSVKLVSHEDKIYELENVEPNDKFFRKIDYLEYALTPLAHEIALELDSQTLATDRKKQSELFRTLLIIVNRTLQSIRNFGTVPHIQVLNPEIKDGEKYMRLCDVRVSDGEQEHRIVPATSIFDLILSGQYQAVQNVMEVSTLNVTAWPDIEEALQDESDPPPEKEFFTNAIEFLRLRNFRMGLLESVICLEIVLTQYLRAFLSIRKKLSNTRINKFLKPEIGLSARLAGLLDLSLTAKDLNDIDVNNIIRVVRWRNNIIHRTGHLPENVGEKSLKDGIFQVLSLVLKLARLRDRINSSPELEKIAVKISENNNIPVPTIFDLGRHLVLVEIQFVFKELPSKEVLGNTAHRLGEELGRRDTRFKPEEHLFIRFLKFPKETVARWREGKLEFTEKS